MKILLFGKNGQVGWELQRTLATLGDLVALDYPEVNFGEPESLRLLVRDAKPNLIVNAAAYTAVDKAEKEVELAFAVNGKAPGVLAEEAKALNVAFIHYSTEYVFDGSKGEPYIESDPANPLSVYGKSKLEGERSVRAVGGAAIVIRTSWVYSTRQGGFVNKVLLWSRQQQSLRIVDDQVGNPTWARLLAEATAQLAVISRKDPFGFVKEYSGLYHLAGNGYATRLEWAEAILSYDPARSEQVVEEVQPALTSEFPTPAQRPLFSPLNCELFYQTFGINLPHWREALKLALEVL
jgi:dTDP-4-dehydrorhamnose reductase